MAFSGDSISQLWGIVHEWMSDTTTVADLIYKNNNFLASVARQEFNGTSYPLPMILSASGGISPDFPTAYNNATASRVIRATAPVVPLYQLAVVSGLAQAATEGKAGAWMEAVQLELSTSMSAIGNVLGQQVFGNGSGVLAVTAGSINTTTGVVNLADASTAIQFYIGQTFTAVNSSNGQLRAFVGRVTGVDANIGQVVFIAAPSSPVPLASADWASGDLLTLQGAWKQVLTGLDGWFPQGTTPFHAFNGRPGPSQPAYVNDLFNISRANEPQMLSGTWVNGSNIPAEQAINKGLTQGAKFGAKCDEIWVSYETFNYLQQVYINKAITVEKMTEYGFSVSGFEFMSPTGAVRVYADKSCTPRTAYLLQSNTIKLVSYGEVPHIGKVNGGNNSLTIPGLDAEQIRLLSYAQLVCTEPGHNTVVSLNV